MKEFVSSALPLVMTGLALAVFASSRGTDKHKGSRIAAGAGFGLLLGAVLNSLGLWENHISCLVFGPIWGLALAALFKSDEAPGPDTVVDTDRH